MAARAGGEVGELSGALRAEIDGAMGKMGVAFYHRGYTERESSHMGKKKVIFQRRADLGDAGVAFLAEKLRGNTIVDDLWLFKCGLGAVGIRALAEALAEDNSTLRKLSLNRNSALGDDCAEALAQMIRKNTTLEDLGLSYCSVGARGACALGEALKALAETLRWNESLEQLDLGVCRMTDVGTSSLLAALRENNSTLTDLKLSGNRTWMIPNSRWIEDSIKVLLEENRVATAKAERRARCLLFCCLMLAPTAHKHVVPSIGAVPVPVMQHAVEHAGKLQVAKRFEVET